MGIFEDVTHLHLRIKGNAIAYMWYCTDSGILMIYTHWYECAYLIKTFQVNIDYGF